MSKKADHRNELSSDARSMLETMVARFEEANNRGERPPIENFLPASDSDRQAVLVELVQVDVEYRLKAGETLRVETYFERYPELASDRAAALDLIAIEYEFRRRRDSRVVPEDYLRRFPQYCDDLPARLQAPMRRRKRFPIRLNCPHCLNPIEVVDDLAEDVLCPSCGSTFRLDPDRTYTWAPEKLPRLGKFELLEVLGHGAFGTVYRARDTDLDRIAAVKVPRSGRFATKEDEDRFVREARAVASLRHPGIVPVYEVGRSDTFPYIVTEYIAGITLADALSGRQFGFREGAQIIAEVADTLDDAHQHGVVHRDIKPSNIMLQTEQVDPQRSTVRRAGANPDHPAAESAILSATSARSTSSSAGSRHATPRLRPRLMDFGLARRDEGEITMTVEGQILGTPAFMSPEQARGEAHGVDGRSDVYSLGVILYQLLTGELPFRGNSRMLLHQVLHEEPRAPRKLNDRIPHDLETITLKCLAKEPSRRFPTAGELADDLRRWLAGEPIQARPVGAVMRIWRWCKRNPRVAILSGSVATLLLVITVGSTYGRITIKRQRDELKATRDAAYKSAAMLTTVGEDLADIPLVQEERWKLLEKAREFYQNIMATHSDSETRQELASVYHRLGDVYEALHQHVKAEEAYKEAIRMFAVLAEKFPNERGYRHHQAISYDYFGELLRMNTGRVAEAEQAYQKAQELQEKLLNESPSTPEYRQELARTENNYGLLLAANKRPDEAQQNYSQAIARLRSLIDELPSVPAYQYELGRTHINLGTLLGGRGQPQKSEAAYRQAITLLQGLHEKVPSKPNYRRALAVSYLNLGNLLLGDPGRLEQADNAYSRSVGLLVNLVKDFPSAPLYRSELGSTYNSRGGALWAAKRSTEAREDWLQAREIFRKLADEFSNVPDYQSRLGLVLGNLGWERLNSNEVDEARQLLEEAVQHQKSALVSNPQSSEYHARLGSHYGVLAQALAGLGNTDQAMNLLEEAVNQYGYSRGHLTLPGFKPLEAREDFKQLQSGTENTIQ